MCSLILCIKHCPLHTDSAHLEIPLRKGSRGVFLTKGPKQRGICGDVRASSGDDKSRQLLPFSPGGHIPSGLNGKVKSARLLMDGLCFYRVLGLYRLTVYFPKCLGDCNTEAGTCVLTLIVPKTAQRCQVL